ncbi:Asp-tRNA(Asn)/Glu-tRNA(Gln) amidotransferase GatCAB subunit C [Lottiidibacillus patelloidae]|uniref:Aspartyl/glutamyl-tRNA(Asn/Gln) amidotransferase subunit C n=1 Tax=Lottiidibacillus patelloidae TaxID=2670334 RepID=A0A263BT12_9BACI|nr:Asp-tRNA(Asn)/Glu-tRNA(Gln) amidotransferase subunit GatC [Lottiidibacillus patelloidae]OZM56860.1 Asp-tRNA(Asn)/Glu-tRNA(Gln) amidotransferase GatCAB subunit C [Lottiidibacillus patelloidae]
MSKVTKEEVRHVAHLARLQMDEKEIEKYEKHLADILTYVDRLNELNTENVKPTTHVLDLQNVLRSDQEEQSFTQETALENAPAHKEGKIVVPSVMKK